MRYPKAKELPSGSFRVQIQIDGKKHSITAKTEEEAVLRAMELRDRHVLLEEKPEAITLGEAYDAYIESQEGLLSPSTITGYKRTKNNQLQGLMELKLSNLTQQKIQSEIDAMAKVKSPKYVRNAHGLLVSVLAKYRPSLKLNTKLPKKKKVEINIPTEDEIKAIFSAAKGSEVELPICLAIWMGMRMSEIRGIRWSDIKGNILTIRSALVDTEAGPVLKGTKTYSSQRKLTLPPYIKELIDKQSKKSEFVVDMAANSITYRFHKLCDAKGIPHYRFHDLRHGNASVMLALNIPDKYAMERMGHATENMLKTVYQHTMDAKRQQVDEQVDTYFANLIAQATEEVEQQNSGVLTTQESE